MGKKYKIIIGILLAVALLGLLVTYLQAVNVDVLNPKGVIAEKQRNLMVFAVGLSLIVVLPVFTLLFVFLHKYKETNTKAKYTPEWDTNRVYETIWWGIPILLIFVLSVVTWNSTHDLDPFKPLVSDKKPLEVQVVALQWKWLFIYPELNIATVNYLQIPTDRPVKFSITADAPMNSFWVPQLGGQIYAMSGMSTQLNLIADEAGTYNGSSANISGEGFAGMRFDVNATPQTEFDAWVKEMRDTDNYLSFTAYDKMVQPTQNDDPATYSPVQPGLYGVVVDKYMLPTNAPMDNETQEPY